MQVYLDVRPTFVNVCAVLETLGTGEVCTVMSSQHSLDLLVSETVIISFCFYLPVRDS